MTIDEALAWLRGMRIVKYEPTGTTVCNVLPQLIGVVAAAAEIVEINRMSEDTIIGDALTALAAAVAREQEK